MKGFTSPKVELFYRIFKPKPIEKMDQAWKRILICNQGGLGDVYLSSFMIPSLRKAFPNCEIGMLTTPDGQAAAKGLDHLHVHPYWFRIHSRKIVLYFRFAAFFLMGRKKIARDLAKYNYDCAIVANPYFSGMAHVLHAAKIPHRIGFTTIGDRKFLSEVIPWEREMYLLDHYKRLLKRLNIRKFSFDLPIKEKNQKVLFHMFSADSKKDLPSSFWKELYELFHKKGHEVYFTGKGDIQHREIAKITSEAYNLSNKYDWEGFVDMIQSSSLLISVDTAAVHIAAAAKTPFLAIYRQTPHFDLWYPASEKGRAKHWPVNPAKVLQEVEDEGCC